MPQVRQLAFSTLVADDDGHNDGVLSSSDVVTSSPVLRHGTITTPRRVAFALQYVAPSPPLRRSTPQLLSVEDDVQQQQQQRCNATLRTSTAPPKPLKRSVGKPHRQTHEKPHAATRKPAWDADVQHAPPLFDAAIGKTVLFQTRPGNRRQELVKEVKEQRDRQPLKQLPIALVHAPRAKTAAQANSQRNRLPATVKPASYRHLKSSIPTTAPVQLPSRPTKDFVRLNFEQVAGRSFAKPHHQAPAPSSHASVRERRSKLAESPEPDSGSRRFADAETSPLLSIRVDSPVPKPSPNQERSPRLSPQVSRAPSSRSPRSSAQSQPSYSAKVFAVLDRQQRGRIGVGQILDGLRLLGLPATHNQVRLACHCRICCVVLWSELAAHALMWVYLHSPDIRLRVLDP